MQITSFLASKQFPRKIEREFLPLLRIQLTDFFMEECWKFHREFNILYGLLEKKKDFHEISKLKELASTKSWWDSIDQLDRNYRGDFSFTHPETKNSHDAPMESDEGFWLRRIAIDHQLMRKELTDTKPLS